MQDVVFSKFARPACLYDPQNEVVGPLYITGWGIRDMHLEYIEYSNWLLKGEVHETDFNQCSKKYEKVLGYIYSLPQGLQNTSQLCVSGKTDDVVISACTGDRGGALSYSVQKAKNNVHYIYGIASFGVSCGNEHYDESVSHQSSIEKQIFV